MIAVRIRSRLTRGALGALAVSLVTTTSVAAQNPTGAWTALVNGGHVVLIRHANAPPGYGGDPPGFKIDDCTTQRNLDALGREDAQGIGDTFRTRGVRVGRIVASPWCRCVDTARLMSVGPVETSWALVPDTASTVTARLNQLKEIVAGWRGPGTLVLVTHAATIRALLGFLPIQSEITVLKPSDVSPAGGDFVGRIPAAQ